MTSYFEIGGHIVECHEILTSPELKSFVSEVAVVSAGVSEGYKSAAQSSKGVSETKDSLFLHWLKVSSLGVRTMGRDIALGLPWRNPRAFALKGVGVPIRAIELNYDYFVKDESHDW